MSPELEKERKKNIYARLPTQGYFSLIESEV